MRALSGERMYRFVVCLLACSSVVFSQEPLVEEVQPEEVEATAPSVQEFYSYMQEAMDEEDWWSAIDYGEIVLYNFPDSPFNQEIPFWMGTAYYRLEQYELANTALSDYLKQSTSPSHFGEAIEMKFAIAEFFREGGKKRLFGSHKLPAILSAKDDALKIYDEVIATLPHHELAAKSLLGKAKIQAEEGDFKPSVETLQLLIQRFAKQEFAADGYLEISRVYLGQSKEQHVDPNLLDLVGANYRKFQAAFPRDDLRLKEANECITEMKELYASHLVETAQFFRKRHKSDASRIYLSTVVSKYPETQAADRAREMLENLR